MDQESEVDLEAKVELQAEVEKKKKKLMVEVNLADKLDDQDENLKKKLGFQKQF